MLYLVLMVFAFVLAVVAALYPSWPRPHFGWLSMACFFAAMLFGHAVTGLRNVAFAVATGWLILFGGWSAYAQQPQQQPQQQALPTTPREMQKNEVQTRLNNERETLRRATILVQGLPDMIRHDEVYMAELNQPENPPPNPVVAPALPPKIMHPPGMPESRKAITPGAGTSANPLVGAPPHSMSPVPTPAHR